MLFNLLLVSIVTLCYVYVKWSYLYWKRNNVPGPKPSFLIGNVGSTLTLSEHWSVVLTDMYRKYVNEPYVGFYKLLKPGLVIRDVELAKNILSKDFEHFAEVDIVASKIHDPLLATNPAFCVGDEWRDSRRTILQAFTPSRLKSVLPITKTVSERLVKFIASHERGTEFDAKHLAVRFTTQNLLEAAFSIDSECFNKENESEFVKMNLDMLRPSPVVAVKFMTMTFFSRWQADLIPFTFIPFKISKYFRQMIESNRVARLGGNECNDHLQMLIRIQEKNDVQNELFLAGHSMALFFDGTETSSVALSFALYRLAANPMCQDYLYNEIIEQSETGDDNWDLDAFQNMVYLEAVMLETFRLNPPFGWINRRCTKAYELPMNSHQTKPVTIQPGTVINIPSLAIHLDPDYYPNPERFLPERFLPEAQRDRPKGVFLAFGDGSRICPGRRFGLAQSKIALACIVKHFRIKLSPNQKPIFIDPQSKLTHSRDGILLKFESRC